MRKTTTFLVALAGAGAMARAGADEAELCLPKDLDGALGAARSVRVATLNAFLNRETAGELIADLGNPDDQIAAPDGSDLQTKAVAEIIQRVRPDILLLNEFDFDPNGAAVELFQRNFLAQGQNGQDPIRYRHVFLAPSNTGIPSGVDLNNDGVASGPDDAYGFGAFPGQFGMVLLSRYAIAEGRSRTFQTFLWKDMPGNLMPAGYYSEAAVETLRLSSKSHWDVVVRIGGRELHVLAAHPTPPVFDGPEDRNGRRNHDEIRFWADYVAPRDEASHYIVDDSGRRGGLARNAEFVIVGDYNADPYDGDSTDAAILQLLEHPAIDTSNPPASFGGVEDAALEGALNDTHLGNPAFDTGDFNPAGPGNLRVDYVLPSKHGIDIECGGVFWPQRVDETRSLVGEGFPVVSSDHHLVWQDLEIHGVFGDGRDWRWGKWPDGRHRWWSW